MINKLSNNERIYIVIGLYIISVLFIVCIIPYCNRNNIIVSNITKKFSSGCVCICNKPICKTILNNGRSSNYLNPITKSIKNKENKENKEDITLRELYNKTCLLSFWGLSHVILYMLIGIILPNYFVELFIIGCLFEIVEHTMFKCGDILDIIWNNIGYVIGIYIHKYICK